MVRMLFRLTCVAGSAAMVALSCHAAPAPAPAAPASGVDHREIRAQLVPVHYTTLAAEIGARIRSLPIPEGASFRAGQLLVGLDCSLQQAQRDKAQAAVNGANKTWAADQQLNALKSIGAVELALAGSELEKSRAELAANDAVIHKCSITAPFAGRIAEQHVRESQYVQPGQALLDILDDSTLNLEFLVPSKWLVWVKPGQKFTVQIDETGKTYPAEIERIGARVDPVSQSIKLTGAIDGHFPELIAGMSGRVQLSPPPAGH